MSNAQKTCKKSSKILSFVKVVCPLKLTLLASNLESVSDSENYSHKHFFNIFQMVSFQMKKINLIQFFYHQSCHPQNYSYNTQHNFPFQSSTLYNFLVFIYFQRGMLVEYLKPCKSAAVITRKRKESQDISLVLSSLSASF